MALSSHVSGNPLRQKGNSLRKLPTLRKLDTYKAFVCILLFLQTFISFAKSSTTYASLASEFKNPYNNFHDIIDSAINFAFTFHFILKL